MRYEQLSVGVLTVDQIIGGAQHGPIGQGDAWYLDGTHGSDGNSGKTVNAPLATLPAAESLPTANQNDVIYVSPATYTLTSELAWDKDFTHLIGLIGPNLAGDHSLKGCTIYSSTASVVETIDITADRCVFANLMIGNGGNASICVGAVNVDGWGNYFKHVTFLGTIADNQANDADCASLLIDQLGHFPIFEDCIIGQTGWGTRSAAYSGVLLFVGTTSLAPQNGLFRRCRFLSRSETATVSMIRVPNATCIDREWLFDDCSFYNFSVNQGNALNQVVSAIGSPQSHDMVFHNCVARGFTEWKTATGDVFIDMGAYDASGGIATAATA